MDDFQEVIDNLLPIKPLGKNEIRISVEGGMVQGMECGDNVPQAITVHVLDHDIENMTPDELSEQCVLDHLNNPCTYEEIDC